MVGWLGEELEGVGFRLGFGRQRRQEHIRAVSFVISWVFLPVTVNHLQIKWPAGRNSKSFSPVAGMRAVGLESRNETSRQVGFLSTPRVHSIFWG